jgi:4-aminobutyrate aminotransferase-like enzyme
VFRLLPPLVITEQQIRRVAEVLDRVLTSEEMKPSG